MQSVFLYFIMEFCNKQEKVLKVYQNKIIRLLMIDKVIKKYSYLNEFSLIIKYLLSENYYKK